MYFLKKYYPHVLVLTASIGVMTGCSTTGQQQTSHAQKTPLTINQRLEQSYSPFRVVSGKIEDTTISNIEWAGMAGKSITSQSKTVRQDVLEAIDEKCGLKAKQLVETRIVQYTPPVFYEVWLFNDPLSKRLDKLTGMSIVMTQRPNQGGVDFKIYGDCHTQHLPQL